MIPGEDDELEPIPDWVEGESVVLTKSLCPRWMLCHWDVQYFDTPEERETMHRLYEDHWRDQH